MPELPEVETVRRGLTPILEGARIVRAVQNRPDLRRPLPERFGGRLTGRRILRLGRRAKYLLLDLDGTPGETLIVHLGMSGRFLLQQSPEQNDRAPTAAFVHDSGGGDRSTKHDHVVLHLDNGATVIFNDARRFGSMDLCETDALEHHDLIAHLGPEPLSNAFNSAGLADTLSGRRTPLKAALLDQRRVAGLGNIYVCEALYRSGLAPTRIAGSLDGADCARLVETVRDVLREAIEAGGSSLRDFHGASGELGYFQHRFAVYGREGESCNRCGNTIARIVQSGRSTFHCPHCQR